MVKHYLLELQDVITRIFGKISLQWQMEIKMHLGKFPTYRIMMDESKSSMTMS
jgi:hypothetical protein